MTRTSNFTTWGLLATLAAMTVAPALANPDSQQKNKNQWRNLGIAGAVVAGYGLLKGDKSATLLGAAGAAYSANRYEQDRHHQSQDSSDGRRYYRTYGWRPPVSRNNGYDNNSDSTRDNNGYNNPDYGGNSGQYDDSQYNNGDNNHDDNGGARMRKHHGKGWYKNHGSQDENRNHGDRDHGDRD